MGLFMNRFYAYWFCASVLGLVAIMDDFVVERGKTISTDTAQSEIAP